MYDNRQPTAIGQNQPANWNRPTNRQTQTGGPVNYIQNNPNYNVNQSPFSYGMNELPGRIVESIQDIVPNEVPMNGQVGLFPQRDYSCIYAKAWNAQGTIDTVVYVPYKEEQKVIDEPSESEKIMSQLDVLQNTINELSEVVMGMTQTDNKPKRTTKKEVAQDV